jgi:hypothetical protein
VVQTPIVLSLEIFMQSLYIYHIHLPLSPAYVPATGPLDFGGLGRPPTRPRSGPGLLLPDLAWRLCCSEVAMHAATNTEPSCSLGSAVLHGHHRNRHILFTVQIRRHLV